MSETIQQAEDLRSRAIGLLLAERQAIDDRLRLFGYDGMLPTHLKQKACSVCGDGAHNARTCPNKKGTNVVPFIQSAEPSSPGVAS
jgi:hypothetical protein